MEEKKLEVEQKLPKEKKPVNKTVIILAVLLLLALVTTSVMGFMYYQVNRQLSNMKVSSKQPAPVVSPTPQPEVSPVPGGEKLELPIVVFEPPLSSQEYADIKSELQKKVVDPFIDYSKYVSGDDFYVSVMMSEQQHENIAEQFPYSLTALAKNGGGSWESLSQTDGVLNWWVPTCMGECDLSDEFKVKYPEIVKLLGQ